MAINVNGDLLATSAHLGALASHARDLPSTCLATLISPYCTHTLIVAQIKMRGRTSANTRNRDHRSLDVVHFYNFYNHSCLKCAIKIYDAIHNEFHARNRKRGTRINANYVPSIMAYFPLGVQALKITYATWRTLFDSVWIPAHVSDYVTYAVSANLRIVRIIQD